MDNPSISKKPAQQMVVPNDLGSSLRSSQQIVDPNDFTLFGNVEDYSLDQSVPKLQDEVKGDKLELTGTVDRNTSTSSVQCINETTKSDLLKPIEIVPAKPTEVITTGEGLEKEDALVLVDTSDSSKNHNSEVPRNAALYLELLATPRGTRRGDVAGKQSTLKANESLSTKNSTLGALLICDRPLLALSTSSEEQTNPAASARRVPDTPIQTTNPLDDVRISPRAVIKFNSCTLHPPKQGRSQPVTQEKPPGCRTVSVEGLPDSATEEMVREIFERFGKIIDLRMVNLLCHVKFEQTSTVDLAVYLTGWRLVVGGIREPSHSGYLFVDYVKSKEDQLEWECQQNKLRIQDYPTEKEKTERPTSFPPVHCKESDIAKAIELVKRDDRFLEAVQLLSRWLEMEDYDENNSDKIFSMIQETNAHAIRLQNEKKRQYEEMKRFSNQCRGKAEVISSQISHIDRLFAVTSQKKVLDHFTDTQKTNLTLWKTEFLNYQEQIENLSTEFDDLALLAAGDEQMMKKSKLKEKETLNDNGTNLNAQTEISAHKTEHESDLASKNEEIINLKISLESLKKELKNAKDLCHKKDDKISMGSTKYRILENKLKDCSGALKNERQIVITLQTEISELKRWLADEEYNSKQLIKQMSDNEREYQHTLGVLKKRLHDKDVELEDRRRMWEMETNQGTAAAAETLHKALLNQRMELARLVRLRAEDKVKIEKLEKELRVKPPVATMNDRDAKTIDDRDAKTISMISSFLLIHPAGVGINFITQYVRRMDPTVSSLQIQSILFKCSSVFIFDMVENKWMLNVHARSEPRDKWTDLSSSRDASSENSACNCSQTKKTSPRTMTRPPTSRSNCPVGTDLHSSVLASEIQPTIFQSGQLVETNNLSRLASQIEPSTSQTGYSAATNHPFGESSQVQPPASQTVKSHISNLAPEIHPATFQMEQPVGTSSLPSVSTSQIQPPTSQTRDSVGTGRLFGPSSQIQPPTYQIGQSVGTTFQSSELASKIQPISSRLLPQSSQIPPQSSQIQPQSSQIQPQSSQIQPQSSQIQNQSSQLQPQSSQMPLTSQIQPCSPQMQPHPPQMGVQGGGENIELRSNGLSTFGEEIRLTNLLKKFPSSSQWSPQLLRRLQEICVFRNKNSLRLKASRRSSVRVVVPIVSDEKRNIYKYTVTIPKVYPEEKWLRRRKNSEEFSSDSISETSVSFSNHKNNFQNSTSITSPTSDGTPQKGCTIAENMSDGVFKTPECFNGSTQNQKPSNFWLPNASTPKSNKTIIDTDAEEDRRFAVKTDADEEHRLARIVSHLPNHYEWSFPLQARLRFFRTSKFPQTRQLFFLRMLDGKEVEVNLPKIKYKKLTKLNAVVIPDKYPEEFYLERREKRVGEVIPLLDDDKQGDSSNACCPTIGNSCLPAGRPETASLPEAKPELAKARLETPISPVSVTTPEETTTENPIGLTTNSLKSSGENAITSSHLLGSHQSKKYEDVSTGNQPLNQSYKYEDVSTGNQPLNQSRKYEDVSTGNQPLNQSRKYEDVSTGNQPVNQSKKYEDVSTGNQPLNQSYKYEDVSTGNQPVNQSKKYEDVSTGNQPLNQSYKYEDVSTGNQPLNQSKKYEDVSTGNQPLNQSYKYEDVSTGNQPLNQSKKYEDVSTGNQPLNQSKKYEDVSTGNQPLNQSNKYEDVSTGNQPLNQSKKYEDVSTGNQPLNELRTLQPQIPYRKPPVLIIKQDQHSKSALKRHCLDDPQEPPAKVKKICPDDSESCSGVKTLLLDESIADKVSEVRKSAKKLQTVSNPEDTLTADDKTNISVKGSTKKINQEENTDKDVQTKFSGSGKSDGGECLQSIAKTDVSEDYKLQQPTSKRIKSSDTQPGEKGSKHGVISAREKLSCDSKYIRSSSKEIRNNRHRTTDSKRTSSIRDKSNKREYSRTDKYHRERETVDKRWDDRNTHKHRSANSRDTRRRELYKNKYESRSGDPGRNNKDTAKKEIHKAKVSSEPSTSLPKYFERSKNLTSDTAAKPVSSGGTNRESCDGPYSDKNDPKRRTIEKLERPTKELNDRLQTLFKSSNENVRIDSQENRPNQDFARPENVHKDLGQKSSKGLLVSNKKIISVDARDESSALQKSNKREEFVKDTNKGNAKDHISQAVESLGTSSGSIKLSQSISKNEDENLPKNLGEKYFKDSLASNKIVSVEARDKSGALEKSNKRDEFGKDTTKGSTKDHISQAVETETSSSSSKRFQCISKNDDENVPNELGVKDSKNSLASNKKIVSVDARNESSALEKCNKREEFIKDCTKGITKDHIFQAVESLGTSSGSSKLSQNISKSEDASVPKDLGEKYFKDSLASNKKIISVDARDKSGALEKYNKREKFVKDSTKGSTKDHISQAVETETSSSSSKRFQCISKNDDENVPNDLGVKNSKNSLASSKKIVSVDARDESSALEKCNISEEFVKDSTKGSTKDHISQAVESLGTSSGFSKLSQNISKNDANVPKGLGEKYFKDSLASNNKIISIDDTHKSGAQDKYTKREEFVKDSTKGSTIDHISQAVESLGTSSGSTKLSQSISKNEDENVPKNLGEKYFKDSLASNKIVSVEARDKSGALEKCNKREEFVKDSTKGSTKDHISQAVETETSSSSSKRFQCISKNDDENVPNDLGVKNSKNSLASSKKIVSVDARDESGALEKCNKREEFIKDSTKGITKDHISQAVESLGTSSGSTKLSQSISKNEDENVPKNLGEKYFKDSLASNKIVSVDARGESGAQDKYNKREEFVKDFSKGSAKDHVSQTVESSRTSSGSSKRSRNILKHEDENVPKDLGEKYSRDSLASTKKIISVDARDKSGAQEKCNKREECVKGRTEDDSSQAVKNLWTCGSSKRSRNISKDEDNSLSKDAEQESEKNFNQKFEDFGKNYLASLSEKNLDNKKQNESPIFSMTFAEYLSSQQPKDPTDVDELVIKPDNNEKQIPIQSRSSSENRRKRCFGGEGVLPKEPEASSSKKSTTEGQWNDVMQTLDCVPRKPSSSIKLPQNSQYKKNIGKRTLDISVKSSNPLRELSQKSPVKKKLCRSPSKPKMLPKIRVRSFEELRMENSSKNKKKTSVGTNSKSVVAGKESSRKTTSGSLKVSVEKNAHQQSKEGRNEDPGVSLLNQAIDRGKTLRIPTEDIEEIERLRDSILHVVDQRTGLPTPKVKEEICRPDKEVKEEQLENYECELKRDLPETDKKEHIIYETSSKNAQDIRNALNQLLSDAEGPEDSGDEPGEESGDVSGTSENLDDYYCDTFLSSEDILRLAGEGPNIKFVE